MAAGALNVTFNHCRFSDNGPEQKLVEGSGHIWRNCWFHDTYVGVWLDGDNSNVLIEDNLFEDITEQAIFYEISQTGTIRRNTIRRASQAIFVSTSKNVLVYENVIEDCWRGIQYFLQCVAVGGGVIGWDLSNNLARDNIIRVGTQPGSFAAAFTNAGSCTAAQLVPYLSGVKSNLFTGNSYFLPDLTSGWWVWGDANKTWAQWQALPQDATGSIAIRS